MKKRFLIALTALPLLLCSCNSPKTPEAEESADLKIIEVSDFEPIEMDNVLILRDSSPAFPELPNSLNYQEACALLDTCRRTDFNLPQSISEYQKYFAGVVNFNGGQYYSFYLYFEANGKKIFVGSNCLVATNGDKVFAKNITSDYEFVPLNSSKEDQSFQKRYPDAKISPNDAIALLLSKGNKLRLEGNLDNYLFEVTEDLIEVNGLMCYIVKPKLEYTDHISFKKRFRFPRGEHHSLPRIISF